MNFYETIKNDGLIDIWFLHFLCSSFDVTFNKILNLMKYNKLLQFLELTASSDSQSSIWLKCESLYSHKSDLTTCSYIIKANHNLRKNSFSLSNISIKLKTMIRLSNIKSIEIDSFQVIYVLKVVCINSWLVFNAMF